jgi:predicted adenylyl cyclase CyaB
MSNASSLRARNIELKARCHDLEHAYRKCVGFGAKDAGVLVQTDTYFRVGRGRLKLRQIKPGGAELIWYDRPDRAGPRPSDYVIATVADPMRTLQALSGALGIKVVINKRRRLLLWQNVRIHLDHVEGSGSFVEFEAVVSSGGDESESHEKIANLCAVLSIEEDDKVAGSYSDLGSGQA